MNTQITTQFPIPSHFHPKKVSEVWRVPYQQRAAEAQTWAKEHNIKPASTDKTRICLLLIDVQNTFAFPILNYLSAENMVLVRLMIIGDCVNLSIATWA